MIHTLLNKVDHLAIAVIDLKSAIDYYVTGFGYTLDTVRDTQGKYSGMRSAVLFSGEFSIVLLQSLTPGSQVDRYIKKYGPGVQHVAYQVEDVDLTHQQMTEKGMKFSTSVLKGKGLKQVFTLRDPNTGMMHEFIQRTKQDDLSEQAMFDENNINQLFEQLEASDQF